MEGYAMGNFVLPEFSQVSVFMNYVSKLNKIRSTFQSQENGRWLHTLILSDFL